MKKMLLSKNSNIKFLLRNLILTFLLATCSNALFAQNFVTQAIIPGQSGNTVPFYYGSNGTRAQELYPASVFSTITSPQYITKIYLVPKTAGPHTYNNFEISLGQPNITSLSSSAYATGTTLVLSKTNYTINRVVDTWLEIELDIPFYFVPGLPLLLEVNLSNASGSSSWTSQIHNPVIAGMYRNYSASYNATVPTSGSQTLIPILGFQMTPAAVCSGMPNAGTTASTTLSPCPGIDFSLSLTGATLASGIVYNWEKSTDSVVWQRILNANGVTLTNSQNVTTYYRCMLKCVNDSSYSTPIKIITNSTPLSGDYTIDSALVGHPRNFISISDAVQKLKCVGITAATTFRISPGVHDEQVLITNITGASETNTIRFVGKNSIVRFNSGNTDNRHIFKFEDADYITLDSLTIEVASTSTYGFPIHFKDGSSYNTVKNCKINNVVNSSSLNYSSIVFSGSNTSATAGTVGCSYNKIINNDINSGYYSIALYGVSTNSVSNKGNIIANNKVKDAYTYSIFTIGCDSTHIVGNDISRPTRSTLTNFYGIYTSTNSYRTIIENNRIHDPYKANLSSTASCYAIYVNETDSRAGKFIVRNNLIYDMFGAASMYGLYDASSDSIWYLNNTVVFNDPSSTTSVINGFIQNTLATGIQLKNNLFYIDRPGTGNRIGEYWTVATTTFESDYNNFYISSASTGTKAVAYKTSMFNTLADWKASNSNAYDQHSKAVDPKFIFTIVKNYSPSATLLDNSGVPLAAVTNDIDGNLRSGTTPDIGAYEYVPVTSDLSIVNILYPSTSEKCGSVNDSIAIVFQNNSITGKTAFDLEVQLSGIVNTVLTKNYTTVIAQDEKDTIVVGYFNSNLTGVLNVKAYTKLTGDEFHPNDTISRTIQYKQVPLPPVVNNVSVCRGDTATIVATSSSLNVNWYDSPNSHTILFSGSVFKTPPVLISKTYYAASSNSIPSVFKNIGQVNAAGGNFITTAIGWGIGFNANINCRIDSVHIYPTGTGTVAITISDNNNTILYTGPTFPITGGAGLSTKVAVPVLANLVPGSYKMGLIYTGITNLIRESSGAAFPYTSVPVTLTTSTNGTSSTTTSSYYWFYDWVVTADNDPCPSNRVPVVVSTLPSIQGTTFNQNSDFEGDFLAGTKLNPDRVCVGKKVSYDINAPIGFNLSDLGVTWSITDAKITSINNDNSLTGTFTTLGNKVTYIPVSANSDSTLVLKLRVKNLTGTMCDTFIQRIIKITPLPVFSLGKDSNICVGQVITLRAPAASSYLWSTGATGRTIQVSTAGDYSVTITNAFGCKTSDTIHVNVIELPTVNLGNDTTICAGTLFNLDGGNQGFNYLWSTGATTQTIPVNNSGTYILTVTNPLTGCSKRDTITVLVNAAPNVNLGPDKGLCPGDSITLDANNPGAIYLWSTGETTRTIIVKDTGTYSVVVTNSLLCSKTDSLRITFNNLPQSTFTTSVISNLNIQFNSNADVGVNYLWDFGDPASGNNTSTFFNPTHQYSSVGDYPVTLTATDILTGCKSTTIDTVKVRTTGINNNTDEFFFTASPNPFENTTILNYNLTKNSNVTIEVYDVLGRKVKTLVNSQDQTAGLKSVSYFNDDSQASDGIYFIRLRVDGKISMLKVVDMSRK